MESDDCPADQPSSGHTTTSITGDIASSAAERKRQTTAAVPSSAVEDLDSFNLIEPPPLDWRSDTSSEAGSVEDLDEPSFPPSAGNPEEAGPAESVLPLDVSDTAAPPIVSQQELVEDNAEPIRDPERDAKEGGVEVEEEEGAREPEERLIGKEEVVQEEDVVQEEEEVVEEEEGLTIKKVERMHPEEEVEFMSRGQGDEDHTRIHALLNRLQLIGGEPGPERPSPPGLAPYPYYSPPEEEPSGPASETTGLLFSESHQRDLLGLLQCTEIGASSPQAAHLPPRGDVDAVVSVSYNQQDAQRFWDHYGDGQQLWSRDDSFSSLPEDEFPEPVWMKLGEEPPQGDATTENEQRDDDHPAYKDVPGPCDPEDLLDGVIFGAKYLGSTQLRSEKNPSTNARMAQAQEAVDRIKAPEGESQPMTEVDLFISTKRIKVLNADTQEAMMDHSLQMISYIADIGSIVVLMARRKPASHKGQDSDPPNGSSSSSSSSSGPQKKCCMICHVFSSEDAQIIAQAIGQAFAVAYQQFLQANGIKPSQLRPGEYSDYLGTQELYNGDLVHFSDSQNLRDVIISKASGEILGLAVVESGWGSILPTVVVANLLHGGPAERSGELSIGDRIMSVNGTSMVGLPIATCQSIIRDLKNQTCVKLSIVHCPPVTMAIIKRPDPKFQLGFSVEDGIICSLMRGGIAERGGIRVGHRIIEINGQSVVATPHDKIIHILTNAVGEIHLKTMPASTYRLLTGQEQPVYL
ncbi:amyloid-beta A4 precursor protein-binding family A member 3 isoform 1-T2 [Polymixia lowei]